MKIYNVIIPPEIAGIIQSLNLKTQNIIKKKLKILETNPYHFSILRYTGPRWEYKGVRKIRIGNIRILYKIFESRVEVLLIEIGPRDDIYRKIWR